MSTPQSIPFTQDAYEKIKSDVKKLQQERVEIMERLKTAREMGDLSENGAYKYAKFELGRVSRQLRDLKHLLTHGVVTQKANNTSQVDFGSTVTIQNPDQELTFTLVSEHESDLSAQKLSMTSPIGSALMGKSVGDTITIDAPAGSISYTIIQLT